MEVESHPRHWSTTLFTVSMVESFHLCTVTHSFDNHRTALVAVSIFTLISRNIAGIHIAQNGFHPDRTGFAKRLDGCWLAILHPVCGVESGHVPWGFRA
jgi:hypothetical protein